MKGDLDVRQLDVVRLRFHKAQHFLVLFHRVVSPFLVIVPRIF
jgi:hypothetical protein